jgi:hypothetical protein
LFSLGNNSAQSAKVSKIFGKILAVWQSADYHRVSDVAKQKRRIEILKRRFRATKSHF